MITLLWLARELEQSLGAPLGCAGFLAAIAAYRRARRTEARLQRIEVELAAPRSVNRVISDRKASRLISHG